MKIEKFTDDELKELKENPKEVLMKPNQTKLFVMDVKFKNKKIKHILMSDITKTFIR